MIKFTIIITALNPGDELKKTVESVKKQKYRFYEIIVKDGGSTDGSLEQIGEYRDINVISQADTGIYDGMNQAIKYMTGDYCLFLNCGDYLYDEKVLGKVSARIQDIKQYHGIYYGDIYDRLRKTQVSAPLEITPFVCYRNLPCHQACFYYRDIIKKRNYNTAYKVRADYDHFLGCFFEDKAEPYNLNLTVASYEGGGYSETPKGLEISEKERQEIIKKYMTPGQIKKYDAIMALTLAPVRKKIANNPKYSAIYQSIKSKLYGK